MLHRRVARRPALTCVFAICLTTISWFAGVDASQCVEEQWNGAVVLPVEFFLLVLRLERYLVPAGVSTSILLASHILLGLRDWMDHTTKMPCLGSDTDPGVADLLISTFVTASSLARL